MSPSLRLRALACSCIAVAIAATMGCAGLTNPIEQPTAELKRISLVSIRLPAAATVRAEFDVTNPNSVGIPIKAVDYEISIGGGEPFRGRAEVDTTIPAYGSAPLTIDLEISALAAMDTVKRLATGSRDYRIGGVIHFASPIGEISLTFEDEGTIDEDAVRDAVEGG